MRAASAAASAAASGSEAPPQPAQRPPKARGCGAGLLLSLRRLFSLPRRRAHRARLLRAAAEGDAATVAAVLRERPRLALEARPLWAAAAAAPAGSVEMLAAAEAAVRACVSSGASDYATSEYAVAAALRSCAAGAGAGADGPPPLLAACTADNGPAAAFLVRLGADPAARHGSGRRTPLHDAAALGAVGALHAVLHAVDGGGYDSVLLGLRDAHGLTPLHFAVWAGALDAERALLSHGASLSARSRAISGGGWIRCDAGSTPLHFAAARADFEAVRLLLAAQAEGATFAAATAGGRRYYEGAALMDGRRVRDRRGRMPFHVALLKGEPAAHVAELLHPDTPLHFVVAASDIGTGAGRCGPRRLAALAADGLAAHLAADLRRAVAASRRAAAPSGKAERAAAPRLPAAESPAGEGEAEAAAGVLLGPPPEAPPVSPFAAAAVQAPVLPPARSPGGGGGGEIAAARSVSQAAPRPRPDAQLAAILRRGSSLAGRADALRSAFSTRLAGRRPPSSASGGGGGEVFENAREGPLEAAASASCLPAAPPFGGRRSAAASAAAPLPRQQPSQPLSAHKSAPLAKGDSGGACCPICLEGGGAPMVSVAVCGHAVCADCAARVIENVLPFRPAICPLCRMIVPGFVGA